MSAYYNENDPFAAAWLRELIKAGHIAPGIVDDRSIEDVEATELAGYTQCHFFAGIGVWSYALRQAGWPDDRSVWTGSPPCQPFSAAGRRQGYDDARHLAPKWLDLVSQCKPAVVFGEQVASAFTNAKHPWIDDLQDVLEAEGYATGTIVLPSCSVGAPHIRQRGWFVAQRVGDTEGRGCGIGRDAARQGEGGHTDSASGLSGRVGNAGEPGLERHGGHGDNQRQHGGVAESNKQQWNRSGNTGEARRDEPANSRPACGLADAGNSTGQQSEPRATERGLSPQTGGDVPEPGTGPAHSLWQSADWLLCRDGRWRPTSPFPQPMADGSAESLGRVCDSRIREFEEEINAATMETEVGRAEILRDLWRSLEAEAEQGWTPGRLPGLHEAPFLLAFMRQLTEQGWRVSQCLPVSGKEVSQDGVRSVRPDSGVAHPSRQRGLEGQQAREYSDTLCVLSSILARHTQEAWGISYQTYAETRFVLADGALARVGRLRGYGNAINAEVAKEVIKAYMEVA